MIFAYADPPYENQSKKYKGHPDFAGEVDQKALVMRLNDEYPDGWALSLSSKSLKNILSFCPDDVRVLVWVKRLHGFLAGVRIQYCWEPVILRNGRQGPHKTGNTTLRDWHEAHPPGSLSTFRPHIPSHVIGRKPDSFCFWIFECLGARAEEDKLHDLFPGSGAVTRAWDSWQRQRSFLGGSNA